MNGNNHLTAKRNNSVAPTLPKQPVTVNENLGPLEGIMALQQTVGNQAVAQLLKGARSAPALIQRNNDLMSIGAISLDLAGGDIGRANILRKMIEKYELPKVRAAVIEVPSSFTGEKRAEMTMQFLELPGASLELVSLAVRKAGAQDDSYLKLLKLILNAQEAAGPAILSAAHFGVILSCVDEIGENKSHLQYVVSRVIKSNDLEATQKKLDQVKKFNFNENLEQSVDADVKKYAGWNQQDKLNEINKLESDQKKQALDSVKKEATETKAVKKAKTDFLKGKVLEKEQNRLAKPSLDKITAEAEEQRQEAKGPWYQKIHDKRKGEYADYYRAAHFHPQADNVLNLVSHSFPLALKMMDIVKLNKDVEALVLQSKLPIERLIDLRDTFTPVQIVHLLQILQIAGLTPYMNYTSYITFLHRLFLVPLPDARLLELGNYIGRFLIYCTDQQAVGHFITLVQGGYTIEEIVNLLDAAPPYKIPVVNKMELLVTLSVKAATANDLLAALRLCERAEWAAARILQEQNTWPNGANAAILELAIQSNMMQNVNKDNDFAKWIRMLAVLAEKNYHTITYSNVQPVQSKIRTNEVVCTVTGNNMNETFVVHGHPDASNAQVGSPNASKIHLKPKSGADVNERLKREQIPDRIWNGIGEARRKELLKN